MPIHEYKCDQCAHVFEHYAFKADDKGPEKCPQCGAKATSKVVSAFSCGGATEGGCGGARRGFS